MYSVFGMTTKVVYGQKSLEALAAEIKNRVSAPRVLICTDEGMEKAGLIEHLTAYLEEGEVEYTVYKGVVPNPRIGTVNEALEKMKDFGANVVLGLGGGSSIDTAKAVAALHANEGEGELRDFKGRDQIPNPTVPLIAVPTTYGTGSETNKATLITDEAHQTKMIIVSPHIQPDLAFVDADLMVKLPQTISAATAVDALTHAVESYTSLGAQPITDALNLYSIELIVDNAPKAVMSNTNVTATANVATASTIIGMAFGNTSLGLIHAIAHALGGIYDVPHGETNAILLPHVMRYNMASVPEKYRQIGLKFDPNMEGLAPLEAAELACDRVEDFCRYLETPSALKEIGVNQDDFEEIADLAMKDGNFGKNPRPSNKEDILRILEQAY